MKLSIVVTLYISSFIVIISDADLITLKIPLEIKERTAKQNMRLEKPFSNLRNHEVIKKIEQ